MSHNVTVWGLIVPDESDTDDVPSWMQQLATAIGTQMAGFTANTWANRPTGTALIEGLFFWSTDTGLLYVVHGGALQSIGTPFGATANVSTSAFGDAAAAGTPALGASPIDHKHGREANPVTAHVAAGDPHTQYALDSDIPSAVASSLTNSNPRYTRHFMLMGA